MRNRSFTLFALTVLLCVLPSIEQVQAADEEAQKFVIGSVHTAGNRSIKDRLILSKVRSRAGNIFDEATAAEDAKRIAELPGADYGYYNTSVVDGKIQLTFVVVEKNVVRSIEFVGNRKYKKKRRH